MRVRSCARPGRHSTSHSFPYASCTRDDQEKIAPGLLAPGGALLSGSACPENAHKILLRQFIRVRKSFSCHRLFTTYINPLIVRVLNGTNTNTTGEATIRGIRYRHRATVGFRKSCVVATGSPGYLFRSVCPAPCTHTDVEGEEWKPVCSEFHETLGQSWFIQQASAVWLSILTT
jgi:hypothetical protein